MDDANEERLFGIMIDVRLLLLALALLAMSQSLKYPQAHQMTMWWARYSFAIVRNGIAAPIFVVVSCQSATFFLSSSCISRGTICSKTFALQRSSSIRRVKGEKRRFRRNHGPGCLLYRAADQVGQKELVLVVFELLALLMAVVSSQSTSRKLRRLSPS